MSQVVWGVRHSLDSLDAPPEISSYNNDSIITIIPGAPKQLTTASHSSARTRGTTLRSARRHTCAWVVKGAFRAQQSCDSCSTRSHTDTWVGIQTWCSIDDIAHTGSPVGSHSLHLDLVCSRMTKHMLWFAKPLHQCCTAQRLYPALGWAHCHVGSTAATVRVWYLLVIHTRHCITAAISRETHEAGLLSLVIHTQDFATAATGRETHRAC
jgi:hypothetical protein